MANTIMTSIYNHYMTTYSPRKSDARLDSHKKSELKNIYNNIIEINKEAPLYLYDKSEATKNFAVALKEDARQLQHTILNSAGKSQKELFHSKVAYSGNEDILQAKYIGNNTVSNEDIPTYEVQVLNLASPQVNISNFLPCGEQGLTAGNYSFDVTANDIGYEFHFTVNEDDTNIDIQTKLARLFNHSNIGLNATIIDGVNDTAALRLVSSRTGQPNLVGKNIFTIEEKNRTNPQKCVNYLGLNYVTSEASNAKLVVNGKEQQADTNRIILDDLYELELLGVSDEDQPPIEIGVKANTDALKDNIRNLIGGYNSFLQAVDQYQGLKANRGKLSHELMGVVRLYHNELDAIGINTTENGSLSIDETLLNQSAESEDASSLLSPLKEFSTSLYDKGEQISRDPLNYAYKKIVAYKNPGKNFNTPYLTSHYSGLLFNYYC